MPLPHGVMDCVVAYECYLQCLLSDQSIEIYEHNLKKKANHTFVHMLVNLLPVGNSIWLLASVKEPFSHVTLKLYLYFNGITIS